jgi:hypothetical protein
MGWFRRRDDDPPKGSGTPFGLSRPLDRASAERLLDECCAARRPAVVVAWPQGSIAPVRFEWRGPEGLRLTLVAPPRDGAFPPLAVATVSFSARGRATVFLAPVLSCDESTLRLRLPDEIAGAEARLGYRVPVGPRSGIEGQLRLEDGDAIPVRLVNLSVSGALVEVPARAGVDLGTSAPVVLLLQHGPRRVALDGVVRRRDGTRYGVFFPGALMGDDTPDTRALVALLQHLLEHR